MMAPSQVVKEIISFWRHQYVGVEGNHLVLETSNGNVPLTIALHKDRIQVGCHLLTKEAYELIWEQVEILLHERARGNETL